MSAIAGAMVVPDGNHPLRDGKATVTLHAQNRRSPVKAITFRILVMCSDFAVVFLLTHRWDVATGLVLATNFASTTLYFIHERIWDKVAWGRTRDTAGHKELIQVLLDNTKGAP